MILKSMGIGELGLGCGVLVYVRTLNAFLTPLAGQTFRMLEHSRGKLDHARLGRCTDRGYHVHSVEAKSLSLVLPCNDSRKK